MDAKLSVPEGLMLETTVPEGWMVEKDEQGKEFFVSPDGTSVASRR